jgi:hypothetical protein
MWVATWLVCIVGMACEEIGETKPTYFFKHEQCELYGETIAIRAHKSLTEKGYVAEVGYACTLSKDTKEANGKKLK